jgi:hypothetical protein
MNAKYLIKQAKNMQKILNVISDFANSFDNKDWQKLKHTLAPTLSVDYTDFRGEKSEVSNDVYVEVRSKTLCQLKTHHMFSNFNVIVNENLATVTCSAIIFRKNESRYFNTHCGYLFKLETLNNHWRIIGIKQNILWHEGDPEIHGAYKA